MKVLNRFMSALGYVPRSAASASSIGSLTFEVNVDSASVDAAIARLDQLRAVADVAEVAVNSIAALDQFATAELIADETPALILAELRKQTTLLEVLAKQGDEVLCGGEPIVKTMSLDKFAERSPPSWRDVVGFPGLPG